MPRSHPPKSITLILPPPTASSSTMPHPSLEVLLAAQRIALEQSNTFDLEAYLTPSQRDQYYSTILRRSPPRPPPTPLPSLDPSSSKRTLDDLSSTEGGESTPKKPKIPGLQGLHWKQRQKKLAEMARAEAEAEAGIVEEPTMDPSTSTTPHGTPEKGKVKQEIDSLPASASYWNHLLVEARKARGPQWDYHSQSFHFDRTSKEYYTHGKEPPADKPIMKTDPSVPPNSLGMTNGTPRNDISKHVPSSETQSNGLSLDPSIQRRQSDSRASLAPSNTSGPGQGITPTPQSNPAQLPSTSPYPHVQPGLPSQTPLPDIQQNPQQQHLSQLQQQFRPPTNLPPGMSNLTPQQLASLSSLGQSSSPGTFNPALAQMRGPPPNGTFYPSANPSQSAAGSGQPQTASNLTPAQLAQMARMSQFQQQFLHQQPRPPMTPQAIQQMNLQAMQGRQGGGQGGMGGMGGINPAAMMGQAGQQVNPQMFTGMGARPPSMGQMGMVGPGGGQGGQMPGGGNWQGYSG